MNADSDIDKELCRHNYYSIIFITINGNVKIKGNCCLDVISLLKLKKMIMESSSEIYSNLP